MFRSPTRVDLAGGTLDLWPLFNFVGGASTINVAIDIWTECEIDPVSDESVRIDSPDLNKFWEFKNIREFFAYSGDDLSFYRAAFAPFKERLESMNKGFVMVTSSQSPIGGGLGGSSSLVISVLKALHQFLGLHLPAPVELVRLAHNIEAEMLRTPTGTQDYFPAVTGGLSVITYSAHGIQQRVSGVSGTPLADHFLLVYTGRQHHSGLNNFEVLKSAVQGDVKVLDALKKIKKIAEDLKEAVDSRNWKLIPELFRQEYDARLQLTPAFSSPEIEKLNRICVEAGADAVKICGAGGGGCVLVWVKPENRKGVVYACELAQFQCLSAKPLDPL